MCSLQDFLLLYFASPLINLQQMPFVGKCPAVQMHFWIELCLLHQFLSACPSVSPQQWLSYWSDHQFRRAITTSLVVYPVYRLLTLLRYCCSLLIFIASFCSACIVRRPTFILSIGASLCFILRLVSALLWTLYFLIVTSLLSSVKASSIVGLSIS